MEFANWLYDHRSQPELRDIKRELSIQINKAAQIEQEEYQTYLQNIDEQDAANGLIVTVCCKEGNVLYVGTPSRFMEAMQWYLSRYVKKSDFVTEAVNCFPNLHFHSNVHGSFNTLNGDYQTERPIIVKHLQALDTFRNRFAELSRDSVGYRDMCAEFEAVHAMECSPQASRDTTQNLRFDFLNATTGASESLCCELHTKLKWHGMDRTHQDRIYFHPGKNGIEEGKFLIAHIGTHM